jgi:hypothetical protein
MRLSVIPQEVAVAAVEMALKPLIEQGIVTVQPGDPTLYGIEQVWLGPVSPLQPRVPVLIHADDPAQHIPEIYRSLERAGVTIPIRLERVGQCAG